MSPNVPRDWWATIALLALILVLAEIVARVLLAPIGENLWAYDSTAQSRSFEWYREQTQNGATPEVVAIGDSTGARNFDPAAFGAAASIDSVYSLARAGNFPRALRSNTLPLLDSDNPPGIVILLQWPGSLRDDPRVDQIEAGAVSPILEARLTGRFLLTDHIYLTRLFRARAYLVSYWLRGEELLRPPAGNGFSPFYRETDATPGNGPLTLPVESAVFSAARRGVITELLALAGARDFTLVAVVGPFRAGKDYDVANKHLEWLRELEAGACRNLVVVDFREIAGLGTDQFRDNTHLFIEGAERFSKELGRVVATLRDQDLGSRSGCRE